MFQKSTNTTEGIAPTLIEMQIQDIRIRTMEEQSDIYKERVKSRCRNDVARLNAVMMPLVGGNADFHKIHEKIAKIASDLNAKFAAYSGTYTGIMPRIWEKMDLERHESDDREEEGKDLSDRRIQLTWMLGVRLQQIPAIDQVCCRAKVRLWPPSNSLASSGTSSTSAPESYDVKSSSRKRKFQDLTSPS